MDKYKVIAGLLITVLGTLLVGSHVWIDIAGKKWYENPPCQLCPSPDPNYISHNLITFLSSIVILIVGICLLVMGLKSISIVSLTKS